LIEEFVLKEIDDVEDLIYFFIIKMNKYRKALDSPFKGNDIMMV
jgi:hypothetical protein